ncbi:MAG: N-acetylmuramoyl-L-alanine amidase [Acidimicrobiales bacterium]
MRRRLAVATVIAFLFAGGLVGPPARPQRPRVLGKQSALSGRRPVGPGWSRTLRAPLSTEMVGFRWDGPGDGSVEVRARGNGEWGPWIPVDGNADEGPDANSRESRGRSTAGPVWVGSGRRDLQVRVTGGELRSLQLVAIHSPNVKPASTSVAGIAQAVAEPAAPRIIGRAQWGADESWRHYAPGCDGHPDFAPTVRNAYVHHTDNSNSYGPGDSAALVRGIYWFHTHTNQWCDIGYNFLVDRYGQVFEGRWGGVTSAVIGAHAGGYNTGSTGVALIGEFQDTPVPRAAYDALRALLSWKFGYHGVDAGGQLAVTAGGFAESRYPTGSRVVLPTIAGHKDVDSTDCPGDFAYALLPRLRRDVQSDVMHAIPYPFGGWQPATRGPAVVTLDAYGDLHPAGSQPVLGHSAYWPGWDITRGVEMEGPGGYVLDGWGGLHQFGDAPARSDSFSSPGRDLARGLALGPLAHSGWVLDAYGGLHPYGDAPPVFSAAYWPGWDIARGVATGPDGTGGYVLDGFGGLHEFGTASPVAVSGYWPGWDIARALALRPDGQSGWVLDANGGLHPFGGAPAVSGSAYFPGQDFGRALALTADGGGGWVLDADGRLWPFGDAPPIAPSLTWGGLGLARAVAARPGPS